MSANDLRKEIESALHRLATAPLREGAEDLLHTLGYQSDRTMPWTLETFLELGRDAAKPLTGKDIQDLQQLESLHLLFQFTDTELSAQGELMDDGTSLQVSRIESYLFFAAELPAGHYTRSALSTIVRALNKPLPMPALVLLRYGGSLSLGIIHRRLHKRDQSKDVLEKITLIKDINLADPIRAHLEILNDFTLGKLAEDYGVHSFVSLHEAWQKRLGSYALSNDFYREIADWYFWAHHQVADGAIRLPQHCDTEQEKSLFLIRLLTRVIFCWFLVEKRLIPTDLFREHRLKTLLKDFAPSRDPQQPDTSPAFYRAVLQNLFFGTLNMPPEQRAFRQKKKEGERYDQNYGVTNLWRYETAFRARDDWEALAARVPFLNGGLFDCLDDKSGKRQDNFILDGFSDREDHGCHLPNDLFFGPERTVDLSPDYGEEDKRTARSKRAKVRGLIEILSRYKFTIEENTPLEEEIALDPELLGKVFENLLASYNEDTRTTARKALGAFYTPREIVSYMVDEALKSYLKTSVAQTILSGQKVKRFNPDAPTGKTQRNLPHWTQEGTTYWVTFRLADSLPAGKLKTWQEEKAIWLAHNPEPWSDDQWREYDERFGQRLEAWLDAGEGECHLRRPDVRTLVEKCLLHFEGQRYNVPAWVIMPNHVHLLLRPRPGFDLPQIMQGIKGVSAKECNARLGRTGQPFWQDESFDHIVRSQAHFDRFVRYIADNPVKAGLRDGEFSMAQTILSAPSAASNSQTGLSGLVCPAWA
jgi:REP element-mobilizing transposase RayT